MRKVSVLLAVLLSFLLILSGCGTGGEQGETANQNQQAGKQNSVKITLMNSKAEMQATFEEAAKKFHEENPDITLEVIPTQAGEVPYEKAMAMYGSGNAPTLTMLDPGDVKKFQEKALDLSAEKWVNETAEHSLDAATLPDGRVIGFPFAVEGYGLIYHQSVLEKAIGGPFDPKSIKTRSDLKGILQKMKDAGIDPVLLSPMDWSLAGHFLPVVYASQSKDPTEVDTFIERLKKGQEDLLQNKVFNGVMDTFDLLKDFNINKADPLSGTYDQGPQLLGTGKVGLWFMGNWAWPQIHSFDTRNGNYGFLPIPNSDNPSDYGNQQIPVGVTKFLILDKEQSTPEQQEAAKRFLNWLVYEKSGQDFLVNQANIIPDFKNIALKPQNPLAQSIMGYMNDGQTLRFMTTLPPDHWSQLGASMQKYLSGNIDRKTLAKEIEEYWQSVQ